MESMTSKIGTAQVQATKKADKANKDLAQASRVKRWIYFSVLSWPLGTSGGKLVSLTRLLFDHSRRSKTPKACGCTSPSSAAA